MATPIDAQYYPLEGQELPKDIVDLIPKEIAYKYRLVPSDRIGKALTVVMINPQDHEAIEAVKKVTGLRVFACWSEAKNVEAALRHCYGDPPVPEEKPVEAPAPPPAPQPTTEMVQEVAKEDPPPAPAQVPAQAIPQASKPEIRTPEVAEPVGPSWAEGDLVSECTFETFSAGPANQKACDLSRSAAAWAGLRILFIQGAVGLGKSHLLNAIGNEVKAKNSKAKVCCRTLQDFITDMLEAIQEKRIEEFKAFYAGRDLILLDDVHYAAGRKKAQQDFVKVFQAIADAGRLVVLTSEKPLSEMEALRDALNSRAQSAEIAEVGPPDVATREGILRSLAKRVGIELPGDALQLIASKIETNARDLEGCLKNLGVQSSVGKQPITKELAQTVLDRLTKKPGKKSATPKASATSQAKKEEKTPTPAPSVKPKPPSREEMLAARKDFAQMMRMALKQVESHEELSRMVMDLLKGGMPLFQKKRDGEFLSILEEALNQAEDGEVEEALKSVAKACKG